MTQDVKAIEKSKNMVKCTYSELHLPQLVLSGSLFFSFFIVVVVIFVVFITSQKVKNKKY